MNPASATHSQMWMSRSAKLPPLSEAARTIEESMGNGGSGCVGDGQPGVSPLHLGANRPGPRERP